MQKQSAKLDAPAALADRVNMVHEGTARTPTASNTESTAGKDRPGRCPWARWAEARAAILEQPGGDGR